MPDIPFAYLGPVCDCVASQQFVCTSLMSCVELRSMIKILELVLGVRTQTVLKSGFHFRRAERLCALWWSEPCRAAWATRHELGRLGSRARPARASRRAMRFRAHARVPSRPAPHSGYITALRGRARQPRRQPSQPPDHTPPQWSCTCASSTSPSALSRVALRQLSGCPFAEPAIVLPSAAMSSSYSPYLPQLM